MSFHARSSHHYLQRRNSYNCINAQKLSKGESEWVMEKLAFSEALYLKTTYLLFHWWWVLQRIILKVDKVNWNMLTSQLCRSKRQCYSHFHFRKYQPGLSSCKGAVRKAKEVKFSQEKYIERGKNSKGSNKSFLTLFQI